jgi:hypothetical protein
MDTLPPRPPDEHKIIGYVMPKDRSASRRAIPIIKRNPNSYTGVDYRDLPKTEYEETLSGGRKSRRSRTRKSKSRKNRRKTSHRRKKSSSRR